MVSICTFGTVLRSQFLSHQIQILIQRLTAVKCSFFFSDVDKDDLRVNNSSLIVPGAKN